MSNCIFCQIAKHKLKSNILYEDSEVVVFPDIHPVAPFHVLIVPKKHITDFSEIKKDENLWIKIMKTTIFFIEKEKLSGKGYRLVINGGGAQIIDHLHVHLMGKISLDRKL